MRVLVEGTIVLCHEELPVLHHLATKKNLLDALQVLNAVEGTLNSLRDLICEMQQEYNNVVTRRKSEEANMVKQMFDACKINPDSPVEN